ncbi:hypothetical protein [Duganella sp. BJB1802]|uniref:hypothetical protein n=1 Tax=Duganella sp. BJB1802 TaxID=2744575 RepID=UPI001E2D4A36|nr:hypothetical protein [Duganella sp. BJB1802]
MVFIAVADLLARADALSSCAGCTRSRSAWWRCCCCATGPVPGAAAPAAGAGGLRPRWRPPPACWCSCCGPAWTPAGWWWAEADRLRPARGAGALTWPLMLVRLAGAALVVPVMEELFWRSI